MKYYRDEPALNVNDATIEFPADSCISETVSCLNLKQKSR